LIVIGRGKLIADCTTGEFIEGNTEKTVLVKSPDARRLAELVVAEGGHIEDGADGSLAVSKMPAPRIGELAARDGLVLHELTPQRASLEAAFMELTRDSLEYGVPAVSDSADPAASGNAADSVAPDTTGSRVES
jgi:ABC-2 type transport system ATP-binding protein